MLIPCLITEIAARTASTGHVGLVGLNLFDVTEEHTTEAYSVQF